MVRKATQNKQRRKEKEEKQQLEEGVQDSSSLAYRIDLMLEQSGLSKKIPYLSSELWVLENAISFLAFFLPVYVVSNKILFGFMAGSVWLAVQYIAISIMRHEKYKKVEESLLTFLELMDNYSHSSDDIVYIMGKTAAYLKEPLKGAVYNFYNEACATGDSVTAFRRLMIRVPHPEFQKIIQNIEMCSRHEANYSVILRRLKINMEKYNSEQKKKGSIVNNARINIGIILAVELLVFGLLNEITNTSVLHVLLSSPVGYIILFYCVIVFFLCIWKMVTLDW